MREMAMCACKQFAAVFLALSIVAGAISAAELSKGETDKSEGSGEASKNKNDAHSSDAKPGDTTGTDAIKAITERFFSELRNEQRDAARETLTAKAQTFMTGAKTPLAGLPAPDANKRAIRVGKVIVDGGMAEVPVQVRAGGTTHKTKLHLRKDGDEWRVFALSATYPDGDKSINFEAAPAPQENVDPLAALVGKPIQLEGLTTTGRKLDMSQYKGKVVLIDFWATWCGPCRAEIPNIAANYKQYHNDGFDVIAVSIDEDMAALKAFIVQEQPPWTIVADNVPGNQKSMAAKFGIRSIPAFILVGKDGKVATVRCRGELLGRSLAQALGKDGDKVSRLDVKLVH
jgi:thiol-disulfide isomerase/thioredoxin